MEPHARPRAPVTEPTRCSSSAPLLPQMEPQVQTVAPHSQNWPRNSEGDIAVFPDGRLLLAWSAFYGGSRDSSGAHLMGRWSADEGATWGHPLVLLENDGKCNVLSVSIGVLSDGTVGFVHSRTDDESCFEAWPFFRRSRDGGDTWEPHRPMVDVKTWHGFPANGRLKQLTTGRLLVPLQLNAKSEGGPGESFVQAAFSDDMGDTWELSNPVSVRATLEPDGQITTGAAEPDAFERRDGSVMFLIRTRLGTLYAADSADGGQTLSEAYDTGLESPGAPCSVARLPDTGDILLVWNRSRPRLPGSGSPRNPLTAAISKDEGRTWGNFVNLESDAGRCYMYPALSFHRGTSFLLYSVGPEVDGSFSWNETSLKLARIPNRWFYE